MKMFIAMSWDREKELTDDGRRTLAIQLFPPFSQDHHDEDLDDFVKLKTSYRQYVGNMLAICRQYRQSNCSHLFHMIIMMRIWMMAKVGDYSEHRFIHFADFCLLSVV